jgi:hypothetical protein
MTKSRLRVPQASLTLLALAFLALMVIGADLAAAANDANDDAKVRQAAAHELASVASEISVAGKIDVHVSKLDGEERDSTFELERFEVFMPQSRIVVVSDHGDDQQEQVLEPPKNIYLRGSLADDPQSLVLLTVGRRGEIRGLVSRGGDLWMMEAAEVSEGRVAPLISRKVDVDSELGEVSRNWSCDADRLEIEASPLDGLLSPPAESQQSVSGGTGTSYVARIAIETDREFFNKFGNVDDAVDYIGDVIAYGSTIYSAEVDTAWAIEVIYLYSSGSDPWAQSSTSCGLYEFGRYWNDNRGHIERTIAHFMSGKSNGGGVAWLGVLCRNQFNVSLGSSCSGLAPSTDNYGGGYGYSGAMSGSFNLSNPRAVWDMIVVTHEIGHNFNSPHTHDYCGIGGNSQPVDECIPSGWGQACTGVSGQRPAGCPGAGNACGTIMSYCHGLGGTVSELSLTLGLGHPYGIQPERVPARMSSHVQSRASGTCLAYPSVAGSGVFDDDFEVGDTSAWGLVVNP